MFTSLTIALAMEGGDSCNRAMGKLTRYVLIAIIISRKFELNCMTIISITKFEDEIYDRSEL